MDEIPWIGRHDAYQPDPRWVIRRALALALERTGLSLAELGTALAAPFGHPPYPAGAVRSWLDEDALPPGEAVPVIFRLLGVDLGEAMTGVSAPPAVHGAAQEGGDEEVKRREFVRYLVLGAGAAAFDPDGMLAIPRPNPRLLEDLEALTVGFVRRWQAVSPAALLPVVRGHLDFLTRALADGHYRKVRQRLGSLAAETALLAGWLSFRLDNRANAQLCWNRAGEIARDTNDPAMSAQVLLARSWLVSDIAAGGQGGGDLAVELADQAERALRRAAPSSSLRARVLARRAEEHAAAGNQLAAERDLERADAELAARSVQADRFAHWGSIGLDGYRGSSAVLLGDYRTAQVALQSALASATPGPGQAILLADLGATHAELGDIDQACSVLGEAVDLSREALTLEFVKRVVGIRRRHLERWRRERSVRDLDERLTILL